jgi:hypothetical protein
MSATIRDDRLITLDTLELSALLVNEEPPASTQEFVSLKTTASGYSGEHEQSTPFHSFLEHSTVFLFPVAFGLTLYFGLARLYHLDGLWWALLAIPLGVVGGDLISGLVHWFADNYFSEDTPVIGRSLVKPFRVHHIYPTDITTHNLVEVAGNACILAVPVLAFCLYLLWLVPHSGWLAFKVVCVAVVAITTVATNQFHKWAHEEAPSSLTRWLQRTRLVLEPSHHELHHTPPFTLHYCITNGWLNPLLNRIKFFRRLESFLSFFGLRPANATAHHD